MLQQHQHQQQQQQQHEANLKQDSFSILFLAFKCRDSDEMAWMECRHPYCVQVRSNWAHMRSCFSGHTGECKRCLQFEDQIYRHAESCTDGSCPVTMCNTYKQRLQQQFGYLPYDQAHHPLTGPAPQQHPHPTLQRRSSYSGMEQYYSNQQASMLYSLSQFESAGQQDTATSRYIGARADEIVEKLDREEPLLPQQQQQPEPPLNANSLPPSSLGRPGSLRNSAAPPPASEDPHYQPITMLSPIVERSEESPISLSAPPHLWGGDMQSLSLMSSDMDGVVRQGSRTAPSMGGLNSLCAEEDEELSMYPEQKVLYKFRDVS